MKRSPIGATCIPTGSRYHPIGNPVKTARNIEKISEKAAREKGRKRGYLRNNNGGVP